MPNRLPNVITTPTTEEMFNAFVSAYTRCMGGPPTKEKVCLLMAQSAFETGWWKYMHCFNVGNVKGIEGDGRDYTFFKCWELVSAAGAQSLQSNEKYGHLVEVDSVDAVGRTKVWLNPDHPGCRFRAYTSLDLGVYDHLSFLLDHYSDSNPDKDAWSFIVKAQPEEFVHALKLKGYFTGDEAIYTKQVTAIFSMLCNKGFEVPVSPPQSLGDEVSNWRSIAVATGIAEALSHDEEEDDKA